MKPCGHVTCKTCTDTLVRPSKQCIVCDTQLKDKDIIELKREGISRNCPFTGATDVGAQELVSLVEEWQRRRKLASHFKDSVLLQCGP